MNKKNMIVWQLKKASSNQFQEFKKKQRKLNYNLKKISEILSQLLSL